MDLNNFSVSNEREVNGGQFGRCEQCGFCGPKVSFSSINNRFCSLTCVQQWTATLTGGHQSENVLTSACGTGTYTNNLVHLWHQQLQFLKLIACR